MIFFKEQKTTILLFHRISPIRDRMWDPMDPKLFEECISSAKRNFNILSLSEVIHSKPKISTKPIAAITFDDGYHDFLDFAIPILNYHKIPATLFVVTDCIERDIPTWTYLMDYYFEKTGILEWSGVESPDTHNEFQSISWETKEQRAAFGKKLKQKIKKTPSQLRNKILKKITEEFSDVEIPPGLMLSWKELSEIKSTEIEVGSHTISHPTLATIEDEDSLKKEIFMSREILISKLGTISPALSYPCGSYNERVKQITKEAGYEAGLAVNNKLYNPDIHDMFEIPRIELYNEPWIKSQLRISGKMSLINQFLRR